MSLTRQSPVVFLTVPGGGTGVAAVPCPAHGRLARLVVSEVGGTGTFTVKVFSRADAAAGTDPVIADDPLAAPAVRADRAGTAPARLFRVCPDLAGASGQAEFFDASGYTIGHAGRQVDAGVPGDTFLHVQVSGAANRSFAVLAAYEVDAAG